MSISKLHLNTIVDIIVCFVIFNVQIISNIPWLDSVTNVLKIVTFAFVVIKRIGKYVYFVKEEIALLLLVVVTLLSTAFNGGDVYYVIIRYLPIVTILIYFDINFERLEELFGNVYILSSVLIILNTISMYVYPDGIYTNSCDTVKYWIIGQKQDFVTIYVIFFFLALWFLKEGRNKTISFVTCFAMGMSFYLDTPFGLMMILLVIPVMYFVGKQINVRGYFFLITFLILEFATVCFGLLFNDYGYILSILESISFNDGDVTKLYTMSQRFDFWELAVENISLSPMHGIGFESAEIVSSYHNMLLDITVCGGVICLFLYLYILAMSFKRLDTFKTEDAMLLKIVNFSILILSITETVYFPFVFAMFFLPIWYGKSNLTN